ncbi:MAG: indolepyruvate oxidoreductase subunit beta [Dehalococcoidia bacterium]|nr:indolepyruvate oxidoreductase subunit beta [Chloroflexota bacterium]MCK4221257.1 indolepyruvate oxidoreductase subunit beta [Dehalococcoidia bacterium]
MNLNILIAGVGGQGNLFASSILARYFANNGYRVGAVETIGAAQRGGSVVSHLRISESDIYSPLIPLGKVDLLVGLETLEMLRNFRMLATDGSYLLNDYKEPTVLCNMELDSYPPDESITAALQHSGRKGYVIAATQCARQMGSSLLTNVVMLGALCQLSPLLDDQGVRQVLGDRSPSKVRQQNLQAFEAGRSLALEAMRQSW